MTLSGLCSCHIGADAVVISRVSFSISTHYAIFLTIHQPVSFGQKSREARFVQPGLADDYIPSGTLVLNDTTVLMALSGYQGVDPLPPLLVAQNSEDGKILKVWEITSARCATDDRADDNTTTAAADTAAGGGGAAGTAAAGGRRLQKKLRRRRHQLRLCQ